VFQCSTHHYIDLSLAMIRRMAALPGSGVRPDQALAIAQAFEKLVDDGNAGAADKTTYVFPVQPR
jgi:hypothetical protein